MLHIIGRVLAAILRRIDDRASDVDYYGFGGHAWLGVKEEQ